MSAAFSSGAHGADAALQAGAAFSVGYVRDVPVANLLARPGVLAVFGFGADAPRCDDARYLQVGLEPCLEAAQGQQSPAAGVFEVWSVDGDVRHGRTGAIRHAADGRVQFVAIEVEEGGDIRAAARAAYARLRGIIAEGGYPHALRIWNYFEAITDGDGDQERYRQFCVGRAEGMGEHWGPFPAATAIGQVASGSGRGRVLQVYALTAKEPGIPIENPRQVSAYRYPRQYGPQAPSFARAMLPGQGGPVQGRLPLLLSGTASVVGHATAHAGSLEAQLGETCNNLERLLASARERVPSLPACYGPASALKVYLRDPGAATVVADTLRARFPGAALLLLQAEVCRRELLVEIDGFHGP